jgi:hypothetical protein
MCGEQKEQRKVVGLANRKQSNQKEVVQTFGYCQHVALSDTARGRRED